MKYDFGELCYAQSYLKKGRRELENVQNLLNSIDCPIAHSRARSINNLKNKNKDIIVEVTSDINKIGGIISDFELAERQNNDIINNPISYIGDIQITEKGSIRLLNAARQVTDDWINGQYHKKYSIGKELDGGHNIERTYYNGTYVCCSTYIAAILYISKMVEPEDINKVYYHGDVGQILENSGWMNMTLEWYGQEKNMEGISTDLLEPGDIVFNKKPGQRHVLIYVATDENGTPLYLDENSCVYRDDYSPTGQLRQYDADIHQVWRAPDEDYINVEQPNPFNVIDPTNI